MFEFQKQHRTPAIFPRPARAKPVRSPGPGQQQPLGNQAARRFAQSCPLRLPSPSVCPFGGACHTCPISIQRQVEPDKEKREESIQTKQDNGQAAKIDSALSAQIYSLKGSGQPLLQSSRDYFEPRYGYDFGHVRVHTGEKAGQATQALGARAFTMGNDIVFGTDQFKPTALTGKKLLAHELAHMVQQKSQVNFPPMLQMRRRRRRRRSKRIMGWKHLSGNIYQATMDNANLRRLAYAISGNMDNWVCIKPVQMKKPNFPYSNYLYNVKISDTFDVSRLTSTSGAKLNLALFSEPILSQWANAWFNAKYEADPKGRIEGVANQGRQIQKLLLVGHPLIVHWIRSGRQAPTTSRQIGNFSLKGLDPNKPSPNYRRASSGAFPSRCLFTRNARVIVVGCSSRKFAASFAKIYLRRGSRIAGTKMDLFVNWTTSTVPTIVGQPPIQSYGKWRTCFARYNQKRKTYRCVSNPYRKASKFFKAGSRYWGYIWGRL